MPAGRPSELTDELKLKIRELLIDLDQRPTMAKISELTGIEYSTIKQWIFRNYKDFAVFYWGVKRDWKLKQAEENIDDVLLIDTKNELVSKNGEKVIFTDPKLLKIKADMSTFVTETLGKKHYAKRTEVTGKDGESFTRSPIFEDKDLKEKVNELETLIKDKLYAEKNKESNQDLEGDKE